MKLLDRTFIFAEPLPAPQCHASTLVVLENGDLLAAWFAGSKEGERDVSIWCSRRKAGVWNAPVNVAPEKEVPHWNPVLFETEPGTVTLFYKVGHPIAQWYTRVMHTHDGGESWSTPEDLVPADDSGGRGPVKNKPLRASNGLLLAPASTEQGRWRCFIDVFDGQSWQKKPIPFPVEEEKLGVIQPSLWESTPGRIHALMRSNAGVICRADSEDYGQTWNPLYKTQMPNNNSGLDCARLTDGRIVLVCNPVAQDWGARTPLTVFVSGDNGKTFQKALDLETEPGEYSYPAVVAKEDRVWVSYTWKRERIVCCELQP